MSDLKVNTISEAEKKTGVKARKIHYLIKTGKIQAQKLGWVWIIPDSELPKIKELTS